MRSSKFGCVVIPGPQGGAGVPSGPTRRGSMPPRKTRIVLYSHDTMGLGHMRRNLLIAQTLAGSHLHAAILVIAGANEASTFAMPPGTDCLTLPALRKEPDARYHSRSLDIAVQELIVLRAKAIRGALEAFEPDLLIVDNVPRGALGELDAALEWLRGRGRAACVLGLRDVLDDPATVRGEWARAGNQDAIRAYYDAILVYGDPVVYDPVNAYRFDPDVAAKVRYTGYFDQRQRLRPEGQDAETLAALSLPPGRLALCLVGGGQDGAPLAEAFAGAEFPPQTGGVILMGPFMPPEAQERLRRRAEMHPRLRVRGFVSEPAPLLDRASDVIAMGGYNTVCEVLSFGKRALIVPRVKPRQEQLIRAERLHDLGLLDVLRPDKMTPRALTQWLRGETGSAPRVRHRVDLEGVARLPHLIEEVLCAKASPARAQPFTSGTYVAG